MPLDWVAYPKNFILSLHYSKTTLQTNFSRKVERDTSNAIFHPREIRWRKPPTSWGWHCDPSNAIEDFLFVQSSTWICVKLFSDLLNEQYYTFLESFCVSSECFYLIVTDTEWVFTVKETGYKSFVCIANHILETIIKIYNGKNSN